MIPPSRGIVRGMAIVPGSTTSPYAVGRLRESATAKDAPEEAGPLMEGRENTQSNLEKRASSNSTLTPLMDAPGARRSGCGLAVQRGRGWRWGGELKIPVPITFA